MMTDYLAAHWIEIAGTVTTVLGIWFTTRRMLICWPVVLAADFLYLVVFYRARLFSDALLQVFFVAFTLYGWWHWWRGVVEEGEVRVVPLTRLARTARPEEGVHPVTELDKLLPHAQVIILIVPSTEETRALIGTKQFALMQHGALLVNAARGPIVDTDALVEALRSGRIRAAIDVTDPEPLPEGHPLWSAPNLMITPHIGGSSPQFAPRALRIAADEVRRYIKGEPLHNVVQAAI